MKRERWSKEVKEKAVQMFKEGVELKKLAKFLNVSEKNAYQNCSRWADKLNAGSPIKFEVLAQMPEKELDKIVSMIKTIKQFKSA